MKRRGFLKAIASLLPVAAVANKVASQVEAAEKMVEPSTAPRKAFLPAQEATCPSPRLRPQRNVHSSNISFFCDEPASRGSIVELYCRDQQVDVPIVRPGHHSGQPMGMLMNDVVDIDYEQITLNSYLGDVGVGGKVEILQQGEVITGPFEGDVCCGEIMYYDKEGCLTTKDNGHPIGVALSGNDENGFVKVAIRLYLNEETQCTS